MFGDKYVAGSGSSISTRKPSVSNEWETAASVKRSVHRVDRSFISSAPESQYPIRCFTLGLRVEIDEPDPATYLSPNMNYVPGSESQRALTLQHRRKRAVQLRRNSDRPARFFGGVAGPNKIRRRDAIYRQRHRHYR